MSEEVDVLKLEEGANDAGEKHRGRLGYLAHRAVFCLEPSTSAM